MTCCSTYSVCDVFTASILCAELCIKRLVMKRLENTIIYQCLMEAHDLANLNVRTGGIKGREDPEGGTRSRKRVDTAK